MAEISRNPWAMKDYAKRIEGRLNEIEKSIHSTRIVLGNEVIGLDSNCQKTVEHFDEVRKKLEKQLQDYQHLVDELNKNADKLIDIFENNRI